VLHFVTLSFLSFDVAAQFIRSDRRIEPKAYESYGHELVAVTVVFIYFIAKEN
jgi:hypothetical protein